MLFLLSQHSLGHIYKTWNNITCYIRAPKLLELVVVTYYLLFSKIMTAPFRSNCLAAVGLVERANYLTCRPATVVKPSLSVSAFYCPATVEAASAISPALSVQLQIAYLFLRSSVPLLDSNSATLQSLTSPGTKTSVIASVTAFSHNLGLVTKTCTEWTIMSSPKLQVYFLYDL